MNAKNFAIWKRKLADVLKRGKLSPMLQEATREIIKTLTAKNYKLAYQISACKSYISGVLDPKDKKYAFQEDEVYNEKLFKESVYSIIDDFHHDVAFYIREVPSGMTVFYAFQGNKGYVEEFKSNGVHPIVKRIQLEHNNIVKESERIVKKR